jgi:two-component system cell cycle sensor histidine kinase/response regulator CckA
MRTCNPDLKIVFMSGYAEDAFEKSLPENQQFAFLPKPFSLGQLVAAMKEVCSVLIDAIFAIPDA